MAIRRGKFGGGLVSRVFVGNGSYRTIRKKSAQAAAKSSALCTRRHFTRLQDPSGKNLVLSSWLKVRITTYELLTTHSNTIQPSNYNDKYLKPFSDACTPQKNSLYLESRKCCNVFLRQNEALPFCPVQLKWQKVLHVHMKTIASFKSKAIQVEPHPKKRAPTLHKSKNHIRKQDQTTINHQSLTFKKGSLSFLFSWFHWLLRSPCFKTLPPAHGWHSAGPHQNLSLGHWIPSRVTRSWVIFQPAEFIFHRLRGLGASFPPRYWKFKHSAS